MVIRWSEEDQVFVVSLPEFGEYAQTHGNTYEEAARSGREVLELLVESFRVEGRPLPAPQLYDAPTAAR
jgi:predicted RNase H-like HicB family nuclease